VPTISWTKFKHRRSIRVWPEKELIAILFSSGLSQSVSPFDGSGIKDLAKLLFSAPCEVMKFG